MIKIITPTSPLKKERKKVLGRGNVTLSRSFCKSLANHHEISAHLSQP